MERRAVDSRSSCSAEIWTGAGFLFLTCSYLIIWLFILLGFTFDDLFIILVGKITLGEKSRKKTGKSSVNHGNLL